MRLANGITQLFFMRHARTEWNEARRIQGWLDSPLSAAGRKQATQWADSLTRFNFNRVVCSDLGRAIKTAQIIAKPSGLSVEEEPRFREQDYGSLAGSPCASCADRHSMDRPGGGETLDEVHQRAMGGLYALGTNFGERILVVTHAGVLTSVFTFLAGPAHPLREGRLLKSQRLHRVGLSTVVGIMDLNVPITP